MQVKYKKIDDTIIVVLDGRILNRNLPEGQEGDDLHRSIVQTIMELNDVPMNDDDYMKKKGELISMMIPPKPIAQMQMDFEEDEKSIVEQHHAIAYRDLEGAKRIADISGEFEYDLKGHVYMRGYSIPLPVQLAEAILDAHYNPDSKYTVNALCNFWQWVILNPNKQARVDLFGWFDTGEFVITEGGLIVAYRNVAIKKKSMAVELENYVNEVFVKVKSWKQSPKNYAILEKDGEYSAHFIKKNPKIVDDENCIGLLSDLHADVNTVESSTVYTDNYSKTFSIVMGEEVTMPRENCNENHQVSCSTGLHFMSPAYGLRLGSETIVILVNPYNIVAFPSYDNTKGRCCAYLPIGRAEKDERGKIVTIDSGSYDFEYSKYTSDKLAEMLNESDFATLIEEGVIAGDLTEDDFNLVKSTIQNVIQKRVVDVE